MLVLVPIFSHERLELPALSDDGGFDARDLERASHGLRDPRTGLEYPVAPDLLDLVYQAQQHFGATEVRVISGYRVPKGKSHSNHSRGRAMDLVLPGVRNEEVTSWAKGLGFAGVGLYPASGFCHLDVRPKSYFWVDRSGPRQRRREVPVHGLLAARADQEAKQQQRHGIAPFVLPSPAVGAIWHNGGAASSSGVDDGESLDDDDGGP